MNIFLFPIILLFDCHTVKMPLETAQLLYSCWHVNRGSPPENSDFKAYKCTHKNHPCAVWARACETHYMWLCRYGLALCKEYKKRYNRTHGCEKHIRWLMQQGFPNTKEIYADNPPPRITKFAKKGLPEGIRWFPLCMPVKFLTKSAKKSYTFYYLSKKYGTEDEKMKKNASNKRLLDNPELQNSMERKRQRFERFSVKYNSKLH